MNPAEMEETVMNPKSRVLKKITMADAAAAASLFTQLMGETVDPRKKFLEEFGDQANLDI